MRAAPTVYIHHPSVVEANHRRSQFLKRFMGLRLKISKTDNAEGHLFIITIFADGNTPFENLGVGVREVEVAINLTKCQILEQETEEKTRPAINKMEIANGRATVTAKGDANDPFWIFQSAGSNKVLDGVYSTEPHACIIEVRETGWFLEGHAGIYLRDLVFSDGPADNNKKRIEERLKKLLLFGQYDAIVVKSTSIKEKADA